MPTELAVPFHLSNSGSVATVTNPDVQVKQHVFALVNTYPPERVTVPGYGVNVTPLLFENMDPGEVGAQVRVLVTDAMASWEPGVALTNVRSHEGGDNVSVLDIQYARKDAADSGTAANSNTVVISANGTVRETIRG
jgi:phage baseplate assembly protein W